MLNRSLIHLQLQTSCLRLAQLSVTVIDAEAMARQHNGWIGLTCPGRFNLKTAFERAMHTTEALEVAPVLGPAHRATRGEAAFFAEETVWNWQGKHKEPKSGSKHM
jgi:hypothetical protein